MPVHPLRTLSAFIVVVGAAALPLVVAVYIDNLSYEQLPTTIGPQPALLIFTARWCEHSAALSSEIKALATAARKSTDLVVARVDGDDEPALPMRFDVNAYPSLLYFPRGFPLNEKSVRPVEFHDYRWAEIIAEFVNNCSETSVLQMTPRPAFLRWREKNPFNRGEQTMDERLAEATPTPEGSFDDLGLTIMREPAVLTAANFDNEIMENRNVRVLVLFYSRDDPFGHDLRLQWRQASSAFTGADNVTIGLADIEAVGGDELCERFEVKETPFCLYFPRCEDDWDGDRCRKPEECPKDLDHTENIIQFLSDRVMADMGLTPEDGARGSGKTYSLTEEQYQQMKKDGVIFANDADQQDQMRKLYEQQAASQGDISDANKEEL